MRPAILLLALCFLSCSEQKYQVCHYDPESTFSTLCEPQRYPLATALQEVSRKGSSGDQFWLNPEPPMPKGWEPRGVDDQWPGTHCGVCGAPENYILRRKGAILLFVIITFVDI
jgi:hypothetical protein